jgi:flagellar basal-body rod protein FlgG
MNISQHPITGGMVQQLNRLDIISNNLANLNTNGYKQKDITTETFSSKLSEYPKKLDLNFDRNTVLASNFANQTLNMIPVPGKHYVNNKSGSIRLTNNEYDFAITEKDTFFVIKNLDTNEIQLTRDGAFNPKDGTLYTKEGYPVLGDNLEPININNENYTTSLAIYTMDYKHLKTEGNNLLSLREGSITSPLQLTEIKDGMILKKNLETSNINSIMEMTNLIDTNRLFEQLQKVSQTLQKLDKTSTDKIGNFKS